MTDPERVTVTLLNFGYLSAVHTSRTGVSSENNTGVGVPGWLFPAQARAAAVPATAIPVGGTAAIILSAR